MVALAQRSAELHKVHHLAGAVFLAHRMKNCSEEVGNHPVPCREAALLER